MSNDVEEGKIKFDRPSVWPRALVLLKPLECSFQFFHRDKGSDLLCNILIYKSGDVPCNMNDLCQITSMRFFEELLKMGDAQL